MAEFMFYLYSILIAWKSSLPWETVPSPIIMEPFGRYVIVLSLIVFCFFTIVDYERRVFLRDGFSPMFLKFKPFKIAGGI